MAFKKLFPLGLIILTGTASNCWAQEAPTSIWAILDREIGPTFEVQAGLFCLALALCLYGIYICLAGGWITPARQNVFNTLAGVVATVAVAFGTIGTLWPLTHILPMFQDLAGGDKAVIGPITEGLGNAYRSTIAGLITMAVAEASRVFLAIVGARGAEQ